jgi:hypothetical protein
MSPKDDEQTSSQDRGGEQEQGGGEQEQKQTSSDQEQKQTSSDTPELSEEGKQEVRRMTQAYDEDRQTAVMPGTDRTITGTAVNEWLDEEGNPKFGKDKPQEEQGKPQEEQEDKPQDQPG